MTPEIPNNHESVNRERANDLVWRKENAHIYNFLPEEIKSVFQNFGYGCLALETDIGVVHICHASDTDIEGFKEKPVLCQWQLIKMATAPLVRLELVILDKPFQPYRFESFLNITEDDQARILAQLANQDHLYLAFYGDRFNYCFTKTITHYQQQWQQLDELVEMANDHLSCIPIDKRNFDQAKLEFMRCFV